MNQEGSPGIDPIGSGSALHKVMKTDALKQALDRHGFDAAFGAAAARGRAAPRALLPPHRQPCLGSAQPAAGIVVAVQRAWPGEHARLPLSNWTEIDVWHYILAEAIPVVPLYFAAERPVVERDGALIMVDDARLPLRAEVPQMRKVRFRTLGCYPLTGAIESEAETLVEVVLRVLLARIRAPGPVIDHDDKASMGARARAISDERRVAGAGVDPRQ